MTISVVRVIPEIGVIEIIAIAHAETAAKRKAITRARPVDGEGEAVARGRRRRGPRSGSRGRSRARWPAMPRRSTDIGSAAVGALALGGRRPPPRTRRRDLAEGLPGGLDDDRRHLQDREEPGGEDAADADRAGRSRRRCPRPASAASGAAPGGDRRRDVLRRARRRAARGRRTRPSTRP